MLVSDVGLDLSLLAAFCLLVFRLFVFIVLLSRHLFRRSVVVCDFLLSSKLHLSRGMSQKAL